MAFFRAVNINVATYNKKVYCIHQKKLCMLTGISSVSVINNVVTNLSNYNLTQFELSLLNKGLEFALTDKPRFFKLVLPLEKLAYKLKPLQSDNCSIFRNFTDNIRINTLKLLKYNRHNEHSNLSSEELSALHNLCNNKNIVILRPDKGNGVVILNKTDYISKIMNILSDTSKFQPIVIDKTKVIRQNEDKLTNLLRNMLKSKVIDQALFDKLKPIGSSLGKLYGLPKIHKNDAPLRPIISSINTHNYNLAKYIVELCTPFVPSSYTTRDCFTFVSKLKSLTNFKHCIMASMDVELFTNVPVTETITIITDIIFKDTDVFNGFNKQQFTKLLCLAVQDNVFMFNNKLFKQVDGVAMGSPLGPLFANFFLGYLEDKYFTKCIDFKPSFYVRYVDDTFALFNDKDHIEHFVAYLNTWHKNLKFTYEIENNLVLSFIGVKIIKTVTGFMSSIYYKQTHTGLYTKFCSSLPHNYKKYAFTGLLSRIYSISSSWSIINDEFTKLRKCLLLIVILLNYLIIVLINFYLKRIIHVIKLMLKRNQTILFYSHFMVFLCLNTAMSYEEL